MHLVVHVRGGKARSLQQAQRKFCFLWRQLKTESNCIVLSCASLSRDNSVSGETPSLYPRSAAGTVLIRASARNRALEEALHALHRDGHCSSKRSWRPFTEVAVERHG